MMLARRFSSDKDGICSAGYWREFKKVIQQRSQLVFCCLAHIFDVGLDIGIIVGWYLEPNAFRDKICYEGKILLFAASLHLLSRLTSSLYIYGVSHLFYPTILQLFDLEIYHNIIFDPHCKEMDIKILARQ